MLFCCSQATRASQATSEETKSWKSGNHKILPVNCKKVLFLKEERSVHLCCRGAQYSQNTIQLFNVSLSREQGRVVYQLTCSAQLLCCLKLVIVSHSSLVQYERLLQVIYQYQRCSPRPTDPQPHYTAQPRIITLVLCTSVLPLGESSTAAQSCHGHVLSQSLLS